MWEAGDMHIVGGKVHEKRLILVLLNEADGMGGDGVGYVFVFPQGFASSFHKTDAADAVHNGHVVSVARFQVV